jgi:GNAT superfamily N-acetyltransferase
MITKKRVGPYLHLYYYSGTQQVGQLTGCFWDAEQEFHMTNLFVEPEWRNQGIATSLLKRLVTEVKKNKVNLVTLDDCSDTGRCYQRFGFYYVEDGYPEMELRL